MADNPDQDVFLLSWQAQIALAQLSVVCCFNINKSMGGKQKCSQCMQSFTMLKLPRKLPTCDHSICQPCIKDIVDTRQDMIICGYCSSIVRKEDIRVFPLNTAILLALSQQPITEQPILNEEEHPLMGEMLLGSQIVNEGNPEEVCPKHKVALDIVCISDKQKICPHCALFGPHRDHRFKRLDDFERELKEKRQVFQEIQSDKQKAFRSQISRLGDEFAQRSYHRKTQLRNKIDEEFRRLQIQLRKKKELTFQELDSAFFDLQNQFRSQGPLSQFESVKQKLNTWEQSCLQSLHKLDTTKRVEDRLFFYYEGPLQIVSEGYIYLEQLNKYKEEAFRKMTEWISDIRVNFETSKNWLDKSARVSKNRLKHSISMLKEIDEENCEQNPFLDCTSSQIVLGTSFLNHNNTSIQVDIASIPSPNKKINAYQSTKVFKSPITPSRSQIKAVRSIEKQRPRMQPSSAQTKKLMPTSPKVSSSYSNKRPISELSSFRSPAKVGKGINTAKELPSKSKDCSFIEKDNSSFEAKQPEKIYMQFSKNTLCDFFDISDCNLSSQKVVEYVHRARRVQKIRGLKIVNNRLTTAGFEKMTEFLQGVSNINAANNELSQGVFEVILRHRDRLDSLRVLNVTHNPLNMDQKILDKIEELKKMGLIVTL